MKAEKLREARETLGVSEQDTKKLEKQRKREKRFEAAEKKILAIFGFFSGIIGFSLGYGYAHIDSKVAYPGEYEPPGGYFLPVFLFISATVAGGVAGKQYIKRRDFPGAEKQIHTIIITLPLLILLFILTYLGGIYLGVWANATMYGVYSRNEVMALEP